MPDIYADALGRDAAEIARMNNQFQIITGALGWAIHPSILLKLPASPAIADLATGTGIFLRSIAPDYPTARLDGYDISPAMFPSEAERLLNVHLAALDAKEPLPIELHGVYDLIHVRYLIAGMDPHDWKPVLQNLMLGLKPGGAIQWVEPAMSQVQFVRARPESTTAALKYMSVACRRDVVQRRFEHGWNTLPTLMKAAGLVVESDVVSSDRLVESRRALTENGLIALFTAARRMKAAGMPGTMEVEEIDRLEAESWRDIESGAYLRYDLHTAVGFKPL